MKGARKSRLAQRVNRSRQLRNHMQTSSAPQETAANEDDTKSRSEPTTDSSKSNACSASNTPPTTPPRLEEATSPTLAPRSSSRAKRFSLVEKRRQAMQRVAARQAAESLSQGDEQKAHIEEEEKQNSFAALEMSSPPPQDNTRRSATPIKASPGRQYLRGRSLSRERPSCAASLKDKTVTQRAPSPLPQQSTHNESGKSFKKSATTCSDKHPQPAQKSSILTVENNDSVSDVGTTVTDLLARTIDHEFGPPPPPPPTFEPLHKLYAKGRAAAVDAASQDTGRTYSPTPSRSPPRVAPPNGRAWRQTRSGSPTGDDINTDQEEKKQSEDIDDPVVSKKSIQSSPPNWKFSPQYTSARPRQWAGAKPTPVLMAHSSRHSGIPTKSSGTVDSALVGVPPKRTLNEEMPVTEDLPTEKPVSPPKSSVAAMMARFGHKTPSTDTAPPPRKMVTIPSWVKKRPTSPEVSKESGISPPKDDFTGTTLPNIESLPLRSPSPSSVNVQRSGSSPVPTAKMRGSSPTQASQSNSKSSLPHRSFSASPVPRPSSHSAVAMPSWVKNHSTTATSPPVSAPRSSTPTWLQQRGLSSVHSQSFAGRPHPKRSQQPAPRGRVKTSEHPSKGDDEALVKDTSPSAPEVMESEDQALIFEESSSEKGPSRFASTYVHHVVTKPVDAIQPQFHKKVPTTIHEKTSSEERPSPSVGALPIQTSHLSPWNKYSRLGDSHVQNSSGRLASASPSPPPTDEEVPTEEFSPGQLRARFRALDKRNTVPLQREGNQLSLLTNTSIGDYEDPPLSEYSESETEVEVPHARRAVIETPEKVSVSTMAGRFGTVRGKEPKKTPPRVVRPNDFWRANTKAARDSSTQDVATLPVSSEEGRPDESAPVEHEARSWSKRFSEGKVDVTSEKLPIERHGNEVEDLQSLAHQKSAAEQKTKQHDAPWWLKPKQADEGIKKVLERAVQPEPPFEPKKIIVEASDSPASSTRRREPHSAPQSSGVCPLSLQEREKDLEVEDRPFQTGPPQNTIAQVSERRRRFDELMDMQTSSSNSSSDEGRKMTAEVAPNLSRRVGVIQAWYARSRGEDPEEYVETTLGESPAKQKMFAQSSGHENQHEHFSSVEEEKPRSHPHVEDEEQDPEGNRGSVDSPEHASQPGVTPQPWRQMVFDSDVTPSPPSGYTENKAREQNGRGSERVFESPGASPLKDTSSRLLSDPKKLTGSDTHPPLLRVPSLIQDDSTDRAGRAPFDESTLLNESGDLTNRNKSGRAPFDESTVFNDSLDLAVTEKAGGAPFDESTLVNESSDLVVSSLEQHKLETTHRSRLSTIRAVASVESIELEQVDDKKTEESVGRLGNVGVIRATASADSIELEPVPAGSSSHSAGFDVLASPLSSAREHPWHKDINTLSPRVWQRRQSGDAGSETPTERKMSDSRVSEEGQHAKNDSDATTTAPSRSSLPRMAADSIHAVDYVQTFRTLAATHGSFSYDDERSRGTNSNIPAVLPPEFANSLSTGAINISNGTNSEFIGNEQSGAAVYGAGAGIVSDHEKAIKKRNGGLTDEATDRERNRFFFPDNESDKQDIFKKVSGPLDSGEVSKHDESTPADLGNGSEKPCAVARFYATTSKDEMDAAENWKDLDPDIDNYSDTAIRDDTPEKATPAMRTMPGDPSKSGAVELDPFSPEVVAALNTAKQTAKKSTDAFDPFEDSFCDADFFSSSTDVGLFESSSAHDISTKKNTPVILRSRRDTKPIKDTNENMQTAIVTQRAWTPTRTDSGLPKVSRTPPRSPPRRPIDVNKIQEDLNSLLPNQDWVAKSSTNSFDEGTDFLQSPETENEFPLASDEPSLNEWSFDQGIPSYEAAVYDADHENIDMETMDESHPYEI